MSAAAWRVLRGEGLASVMRRGSERVAEAWQSASERAAALTAGSDRSRVLNVMGTRAVDRDGGVAVQLRRRLARERLERPIALLHPSRLELSRPHSHRRGVAGAFADALDEALSLTGAEVVHIEGLHDIPLTPLDTLQRRGVRLVLTLHDFSLWTREGHLGSDALNTSGVERATARDLLLRADRIVVPSRYVLECHRALFELPPIDARIIEPGIDDSTPQRGGHRPRVAYAGSVQRHKGAHLLPEIIRATGDDVEWSVFGGGEPELLRAIRREHGVRVHGYYRAGTLPSLLAAAGVGVVVIPSIVPETFSLVASEAWHAGAIVVAFDDGAIAERVRAHGGGLLVPRGESARGLAEAVLRLRRGEVQATPPPSVPTTAEAATAHLQLYASL